MTKQHERLIVLSNRLPFSFRRDESGKWRTEPSGGGLVTALLPVLRHRGGIWIGWPGSTEEVPDVDSELAIAGEGTGFTLQSVALTPEEVRNFYEGFSNEVIWPLFHDLQLLCNFDPVYWRTYREVNRKFARVAHAASAAGDFIWVHDYHLMNVALDLRRLGTKARVGFFLHIPFPPPDTFLKLPWRVALIDALLQFDLVGFQTAHDRRNFVQCVRALVKDADIDGRGQVAQLSAGGREVRIGNFPISIDYNAFMRQAASPEVAARAKELHRMLPNRKVILGIDRLDYTKGIPQRLQAFNDLLTRYPDLRERVSLIQVVVPSREDIAEYRDLKIEIERIVGRINGSFVQPGGWVPVWYVYRSLSRLDLIAYYRAADIGLITPLKDGMNLVAKEYCACSIEEDCTLILSEFAGAAAQLGRSALLVNPYDIEGVADTIHRAYHMDKAERQARMRRLRRSIREYDVFWWVDSFLHAAITKDLRAFPLPENHVTDESADHALLF
ncbi:MAG: trehalose-6-phosphate synthase [Betaproteobacteria bacterium]|nr:trehalose-6-phosphate synthase [Betaproteobacteria bacterium]MDH3436641.1 trehalose-6-phosphate synthase [Betaproteobacteria bacterium]